MLLRIFRNYSLIPRIAAVLVAMPASRAHAQSPEWTNCKTVDDCAVVLNPCGGLEGVNKKFFDDYRKFAESTPWHCPGYMHPGDPTTSRYEAHLARLVCERSCQVRWEGPATGSERPVSYADRIRIYSWRPYSDS